MPRLNNRTAQTLKSESATSYTRSRTLSKRNVTAAGLVQADLKSPSTKPTTRTSANSKKIPTVKSTVSNMSKSKVISKRKASDLPVETAPKRLKTSVSNPAPVKASVRKRLTTEKQKPKKDQTVKALVAKKPIKIKKDNFSIELKSKPQKKAATAKQSLQSKAVPKRSVVKNLPEINTPPTQRLDIFVFGEGSAGELGLGAVKINGKGPVDVKRPRLNPLLSAKDVGIVQVAVGGMHCAALTHDNKILTWGVNDQGALGREAAQGGKMKNIEENIDSGSDSDDSNEDSGLNPNEAEPREIDTTNIDKDTKFTAVFAGDSTTFALTTDGRVYGWGTFRGNDGVLGFRQDVKTQYKPMLIPELKNIINIACGTNHVLALDTKGKVFTWGAGEQNQLARRVVTRTAMGALVPREFGLGRKKITHIGCGDYHSFAIDSDGDVYSWGLNTFGQTGVPKEGLEEPDDNTVQLPTTVESLRDFNIKQITGGAHHTLACTETGEVLVWGRIDNYQGGMEISDLPQDKLFYDESNRPRYLTKPTQIPDIKGAMVSTANDTCIVVDTEGKAYSWGFSGNYQTGQGKDDDVTQATCIENSAVNGHKLVFAGVGGQFGLLGGIAENE